MNNAITLPNGNTMSWDEFSALSHSEQEDLMKAIQKNAINPEGLPTKRELLPRIRAAAERGAVSEDDILTFIKIVHDVFFPPDPIAHTLPGKSVRKNVRGAFVNQSKAVITPAGEFDSMANAGRFYGTDGSRIRCWIRDGKPGFSYKNKQ